MDVKSIGSIQNKIVNSNYEKTVNRSIEFERILDSIQSSKKLKVSGHAQDRLNERNIKLDDDDISNLNNAAEAIREKGGKEAVIFYRDVAFLTSIKNNTIITAIDKENLKGNIFTNIDSTLIL